MVERVVTVDSLLMPGTPVDVAARYRSLAARAEHTDFDLLEEDLVVLDTETTGLSFRECELIQIAAARVSGRSVVERFETFVRPHGPIPAEIVALTGIGDADVAGAPRAKEAVAQLAEFVGGMPVLAHNALFDRTFVQRVPGGREVSDAWVDTLALSRMALPRLTSHRLADLAAAFGCEAVTHRAGDDVDALVGVWRIILLGLSDLPRGLLGQLAGMHPEEEWAFRPVLAHLAAREVDGAPFSLRDARHVLVRTAELTARPDAAERTEPLHVPSREEIEAAFAPEGVVGAMYGGMGDAPADHGRAPSGSAGGQPVAGARGYEERPEQLAMALEVREALATGTHRAIEAGTGVGKSVAYLLPELLFAQANRLTVGVATKTNALTDQLVSHELPALAAALPGGASFVSLKGYDHYPCLRKLELAAGAGELPAGRETAEGGVARADEMLTALAVTYAYACQSPEGDLDALGIRWRVVPRELLTTTPSECRRGRCPFYPNECLLHGARRRAAAADVVVTNHSLLLRNVAADGKILPPVRHWVVDEAHGFEAEARRQWAREVSGVEARRGFEALGGARTGALRSLLVQVGGMEGEQLYARLLTALAAAAGRAALASAEFFDALHALVAVARGGGGYDQVTLWVDARVRASDEWAALAAAGWALVERLDDAVRDAASCVEALSAEAPSAAADLTEATRFLRDMRAGVELVLEGTDETYVYSAELSRRRGAAGSERLVAEKVDVGADLAARWLPEMESVVFSSATIAVGESFEHFDHAVGLDLLPAGEHAGLRLASSYDFDANMAVVVCRDLPAPSERGYLPALEDLLFDVHVGMGGSVLTLFTNRREMEAVWEGLRPRLAQAGLELACQERGASPRRLREKFLMDRRLSLLALRSFWEGFDAAGDTLRCVVIPKLPFAAPSDPLVRERDRREERSWWRHSLPEAVIAVKQAAGRLIRSGTDTGVLVLADSRLVSKSYGRTFVASLPSGNVARLEADNVRRYVEAWRAGHER